MATSDSVDTIDQGSIQINDALIEAFSYLPDLIVIGTINRDSDGVITTAEVVWPDGVEGTFTTLVASPDFLGAIDSYSVTHRTSTYTQPTMTRDDTGAVIVRPEVVVT